MLLLCAVIPIFCFSLKQIQVTNPAIDPLREGLVMSLEVNIGKRSNILEVGPENASQVVSHTIAKSFLLVVFVT